MVRPPASEQEEYAELLLDNIFRCQCCKKVRNRNRLRKVMGFASWRIAQVCDDCFEELALSEV
jgi:hypothetical protein